MIKVLAKKLLQKTNINYFKFSLLQYRSIKYNHFVRIKL